MKTDCLAIENPHYYKTNSIPSEPPDVKYSDSLTSISNQVCNNTILLTADDQLPVITTSNSRFNSVFVHPNERSSFNTNLYSVISDLEIRELLAP